MEVLAPRRAHAMRIAVHAHTPEELIATLDLLLLSFRTSGPHSAVSSLGYSVEYEHDQQQTREKYEAELDAFVKASAPRPKGKGGIQ